MTDAWEEITGQTKETYEQIRARSVVLQPTVALTEQELAEREVAGRERMRVHDRRFAEDFLSIDEERIISRTLARRLGYSVVDRDID